MSLCVGPQYVVETPVEKWCGEGIFMKFLLIKETAADPYFLEAVHQKGMKLYQSFPISCLYVYERCSLKHSARITRIWMTYLILQ